MYWTLNTVTQTPAIYGNMSIMSRETGVSYNVIRRAFSVNKKVQIYSGQYWIVKTDVVRSVKKK